MAQGRINSRELKGTSGAGAAQTVTSPQTAPTDQRFRVASIAVSYSAAPTGGGIQIGSWDGATFTAQFDFDMATSAPLVLPFAAGLDLRCLPGQSLRAIQAGGGGAIVGKLNLIYYLEF